VTEVARQNHDANNLDAAIGDDDKADKATMTLAMLTHFLLIKNYDVQQNFLSSLPIISI